eukprot:gene2505-3101_t
MAFKDRTSEFSSLAETVKKRQEQNGQLIRRNQHQRSQKSQFSYAASEISRGVYETSEKLIELTKLAKDTNIFTDQSSKIEELTYIIKQDIQKLNRDIAALSTLSKSSRQPNKQTEDHSETVVGFLNTKLINATKDFKDILEVRTESLKQQQEKKDSFAGGYSFNNNINNNINNNNNNNNNSFNSYNNNNSNYYSQDNSGLNSTSSSKNEMLRHRNISTTTNRDDSALYKYEEDDRTDEHSILMPEIIQTTDYTSSRLRAAESIASTVHQLETIFSQLADIVSQQNEVIERIDTDIDDSLNNASRAHESLLKTLTDISSNREIRYKLISNNSQLGLFYYSNSRQSNNNRFSNRDGNSNRGLNRNNKFSGGGNNRDNQYKKNNRRSNFNGDQDNSEYEIIKTIDDRIIRKPKTTTTTKRVIDFSNKKQSYNKEEEYGEQEQRSDIIFDKRDESRFSKRNRWENKKIGVPRGKVIPEHTTEQLDEKEMENKNDLDLKANNKWKDISDNIILYEKETKKYSIQGEGLYGVHPIYCATKSNNRTFNALYIQEPLYQKIKKLNLGTDNMKIAVDDTDLNEIEDESQDTFYFDEHSRYNEKKNMDKVLSIYKKVKKLGVPIYLVEKNLLNKFSNNNVHQGLVMDSSPLSSLSIDFLDDKQAVFNEKTGRYPLWVLLDELWDSNNLGAIIRSCHFLGVDSLVVTEKNTTPLTPNASKTSSGAMEEFPIYKTMSTIGFLRRSKEKGWNVIGTGLDGDLSTLISADSPEFKLEKPTILVLGNEGFGIKSKVLEYCDKIVKIPSSPNLTKDSSVDSLNVLLYTNVDESSFKDQVSKIQYDASQDEALKHLTLCMDCYNDLNQEPWSKDFKDLFTTIWKDNSFYWLYNSLADSHYYYESYSLALKFYKQIKNQLSGFNEKTLIPINGNKKVLFDPKEEIIPIPENPPPSRHTYQTIKPFFTVYNEQELLFWCIDTLACCYERLGMVGEMIVLYQIFWNYYKPRFRQIINEIKGKSSTQQHPNEIPLSNIAKKDVQKGFFFPRFFDFIINFEMLEEFCYLLNQGIKMDILPRGVSVDNNKQIISIIEQHITSSTKRTDMSLNFLLSKFFNEELDHFSEKRLDSINSNNNSKNNSPSINDNDNDDEMKP